MAFMEAVGGDINPKDVLVKKMPGAYCGRQTPELGFKTML